METLLILAIGIWHDGNFAIFGNWYLTQCKLCQFWPLAFDMMETLSIGIWHDGNFAIFGNWHLTWWKLCQFWKLVFDMMETLPILAIGIWHDGNFANYGHWHLTWWKLCLIDWKGSKTLQWTFWLVMAQILPTVSILLDCCDLKLCSISQINDIGL